MGTSLGLPTDLIDMAFVSNYPRGAGSCIINTANALRCTNLFVTQVDAGAWSFTTPVKCVAMLGG
jgi:hypothetical protein